MIIFEEILNWKGVCKVVDIFMEIFQFLNEGKIVMVNFMEWFVLDQCILLKNFFKIIVKLEWLVDIEVVIDVQKKFLVNNNVKIIGLVFG